MGGKIKTIIKKEKEKYGGVLFDFCVCQGSEDVHAQECGVCSVTGGQQGLSPLVQCQRVQTLCCFLSLGEDYCRLPPPLAHSLLALVSPLCAPHTPAGPQTHQHEAHLQDTNMLQMHHYECKRLR